MSIIVGIIALVTMSESLNHATDGQWKVAGAYFVVGLVATTAALIIYVTDRRHL